MGEKKGGQSLSIPSLKDKNEKILVFCPLFFWGGGAIKIAQKGCLFRLFRSFVCLFVCLFACLVVCLFVCLFLSFVSFVCLFVCFFRLFVSFDSPVNVLFFFHGK